MRTRHECKYRRTADSWQYRHNRLLMIDKLLPIWQRVLCRNDVKITDSFFELGGDAESAAKLFREIAEVGLGQHSPLLLYRAPTIELLAEFLSGPKPIPFSGALPLRTGGSGKFLFLTHGLGGNVMEFARVVRYIDVSLSIYGLQARGSDGCATPCETVEEMAEDYLQHVRKIQPQGPYFLIGYSHGGLVMLELARRLAEAGQRIAVLIMIDSFPHLRYVPLGPKLRVYYRAIQRRYARGKALGWRKMFGKSDGYGYNSLSAEAQTFSAEDLATRAVRGASTRSLARYRPSYYDGRVCFIRAESIVNFPDDPTAVWSRWVRQFELTSVPGDHHSVLSDYTKELGMALSRYIRTSEEQQTDQVGAEPAKART
jgi:thioesterase domain-containing protein